MQTLLLSSTRVFTVSSQGTHTTRRCSGIISGLIPAEVLELESGVDMGWHGYRGSRVGVGRTGGEDLITTARLSLGQSSSGPDLPSRRTLRQSLEITQGLSILGRGA